MKISNIFVGQRANKNEKLYYEVHDYNVSPSDNDLGKLEISDNVAGVPADQEYFGGGTHGSYIDDGDIYPNKAGVFDLDVEFETGPPFGSANIDGRIVIRIYLNDGDSNNLISESYHEIEVTADNADRWTTVAVGTFTPMMKKGDYLYIQVTQEFDSGLGRLDNVTLRLSERARGAK